MTGLHSVITAALDLLVNQLPATLQPFGEFLRGLVMSLDLDSPEQAKALLEAIDDAMTDLRSRTPADADPEARRAARRQVETALIGRLMTAGIGVVRVPS